MKVVRENKVEHDDKKRELVSGKGTAIIMKENIKTQPAADGFNNDKTAVHIININKTKGENLVVGVY